VGSLRISELAELAEVPVSTLRYYERIGLLPAPRRLQNGYRVYDEAAIEQLAFISRAKRMGVPLEQVSELIELWSTGGCRPFQERISSFLVEKVTEVRTQRRELADFERQLEGLLGRLDSSVSSPGLCDRGDLSCTLEQDDQAERINQWRELIAHGEVEAADHGLRVSFDRSAEIAERVARLSADEVACCSFFSFSIEISALVVVLLVRVPEFPDARAMCEIVFGPIPEIANP
jgi:MerR family copper efflux transcriptional regulator